MHRPTAVRPSANSSLHPNVSTCQGVVGGRVFKGRGPASSTPVSTAAPRPAFACPRRAADGHARGGRAKRARGGAHLAVGRHHDGVEASRDAAFDRRALGQCDEGRLFSLVLVKAYPDLAQRVLPLAGSM